MFKWLKRAFSKKEGGTLVGNLIRAGASFASGGLLGKSPMEIVRQYQSGESSVDWGAGVWKDRI